MGEREKTGGAGAEAEVLALKALGWMAAEDAIWGRFLSATGAAPGDLRTAAADPSFLAAVLDFLMQSDAQVMAFCDACGYRYDAPMAARRALPGGADPNWT